MKTYITRINGGGLWDRSHYMQHMVAEIAHQIGYQEMGIYRYNADSESGESLSSRLDGIIAGINRGDFVICQFPTGNGRRFEYELVNRLKAYGGRIAIYIHEPEALAREQKNQIGEIVGLYNLAEVLIVPSYAMRRLLTENGIRKEMKFIIQEMWDCPVDENFLRSPVLKKEIQYAGDVGFDGMENWGGTIPLKLYGVSTNKGQNVSNINIPLNESCRELSNGGFGLVWYTDREERQYMEYSIPFSLSRYLASGIPVIVPIGSASQALIAAEHLGVAVNSLNEAVAAIERMDEVEYQQYAQNVRAFALALRTGYYTKKCLIDAVHAFCRKDADRIMIPVCNYYLSDYEFNSVVLGESYGGNLALSWSFKGKPDGFLIYDASGALLYETKNVHMHYFSIENYKGGNTFIIKAYVDTLKGRLIVAEASPSSLRIMQYEKPKVSLLMSAYNAEDFIARGIDTALAQSFQDLEIVVVDDGSEDNTSDIIDWYAVKYYNVIAIHQKNGGTPTGRNAGIKHAHGEYIGFLDSDDMLHPDMISRLYNAIRANDCDIAITSMYLVQNDGYSILAQYPMEENVTVTVDNFFRMHFDTGCMFATVVVNKLYRSSLVKEYPFPIMQVEDNAWTPYILSYAEKVCYINDCSYEYDRTIYTNTVTDKLVLKPREELYSIHKNAIMFYLENGNPKRIGFLKRLARRQLLELGRAYKYDAYEKLWMEIDKNFHTA